MPINLLSPQAHAELVRVASTTGNPLIPWLHALIKRNPSMLTPVFVPGGTFKGRTYTLSATTSTGDVREIVIAISSQKWRSASTSMLGHGLVHLKAHLAGRSPAEVAPEILERCLQHLVAWAERRTQGKRRTETARRAKAT